MDLLEVEMVKEERITFSKTRDGSKFPHSTFDYRFEDRRKQPKLNLAWFQRIEHVEDYVRKHNLRKRDYRIFQNVSKK